MDPSIVVARSRSKWSSLNLLLVLLLLSSMVGVIQAHGGGGDDDHDGDVVSRSNLRSKPLVLTKVWCLLIAFVATFLSGMSPYFFRWNASFLVLGTQFAGGVFLGTALMHFLSDSNETFQDRVPDKSYPFAFMLATGGYLLTMLGDSTIAFVHARNASSKRTTSNFDHEQQNKSGGAAGGEVDSGNAIVAASAVVKEASWGDTLLLILALCFHSVFEGIAIGVAATERDAWRNLWTICLHKLFAAIAMGIALLKILPNRPLLSSALYAFAFAISTPIGVAIGIIIDATTEGATADWLYAISMGIACGVFVYVAINHLLAKGFTPQKPCAADAPFPKFLAVTVGAAVIAIVMIWD